MYRIVVFILFIHVNIRHAGIQNFKSVKMLAKKNTRAQKAPETSSKNAHKIPQPKFNIVSTNEKPTDMHQIQASEQDILDIPEETVLSIIATKKEKISLISLHFFHAL